MGFRFLNYIMIHSNVIPLAHAKILRKYGADSIKLDLIELQPLKVIASSTTRNIDLGILTKNRHVLGYLSIYLRYLHRSKYADTILQERETGELEKTKI